MTCRNIMIVGVGGQGTPLTSRILGKLAIGAGYDVKLPEVHGMTQKGRGVVTLVRYGEKVNELIVGEGQTDVLIVPERLEALRYPHFLKKDGVVIVSDWCIDPITVVAGVMSYSESVPDTLKEVRKTTVMEAIAEAEKLGAPRASNIIMLGVAARHVGFEKQDQLSVVETTVPPETIEVDRQTFRVGYAPSL